MSELHAAPAPAGTTEAGPRAATAVPRAPARTATLPARTAGPQDGPGAAREWVERLWTAVRAGDEHAALAAARDALDAGLPPETVLLDVIGAVQRRVGEEWAANRMTVTMEHMATAINDRVVAALPLHPAFRPAPGPGARRATVACVDGEWHALPARLLAEVLRLRGWQVDYLGAQVPAQHLIPHLHLTGPDVVALSGSLATRLPTAHATVTACQAAGVPVIAGGAAFGPGGRYADLLGADAWAPDARVAADLLDAGLPPRPAPAHLAFDDLPHLADQEYTMVVRSASALVRETLAGLEERFPAMREYDELQRQHTAEDIAHIVDFLGAALYADDDGLFEGFLVWTAGILTARKVPAASLLPALALLSDRLGDFPRSTRILAAGTRALRAGPPATTPGHGKPV